MARTKSTRPSPRDDTKSPPRKPPPREEVRQQQVDTSLSRKSGVPSMKTGASSGKEKDSSSRHETRANRGSGAATRRGDSSARSHHSGRSHGERRSHGSRHKGDREERFDCGRGSGYYNSCDRGRSQHHRAYERRYTRSEQFYPHGRDRRSLRDNDCHGASGLGRERGGGPPPDHNYYSRDCRDRKGNYSHTLESNHGQVYSRHGYERSYDNCHAPPNPDYGSAPPRNEYQSTRERSPDYDHRLQAPDRDDHQLQRERRAGYDSAPAPTEFQSNLKTSHPPLASSQAPSRNELSENKKLQLELEREELETRIAQQKLEKERIKQQLIQMKKNDAPENVAESSVSAAGFESIPPGNESAVHSENVVASSEVARNSKSPAEINSRHLMDDDSDSDDAAVLPRKKTRGKKGPATQTLIDSDSDADFGLPRNKSSNSKGMKRAAKPPSTSRKKKTSRWWTGGKECSGSTKMKLREAHIANNENMKMELLKAYEEEKAKRKARKLHYYTEKDLMSSYTPDIIDHYLMAGGERKFLVEWVPSVKGNRPAYNDGNPCLSWISHEEFLFPALARSYIRHKINSEMNDNEVEALKLWVDDCEERERCLNCLNTFDANNEHESHMEIDFCCFLCRCPWDHKLKHTIRNCEAGLKFHRGCCHQYQDLHHFESTFISPVGNIQMELIKQLEENEEESEAKAEGENENEAPHYPEAQNENITENSSTSQVTIVDGCSEKYLRCIKSRSTMERKRDAVVVCINAGVGSATVSLKHLGVSIAKVIHVETDPVAHHVIRSNHDFCYGETDDDDRIQHITGLYDQMSHISEDHEKMVQKYGPIDMIICNSFDSISEKGSGGKGEEKYTSFSNKFFDIVKSIENSNRIIHGDVEEVFFLLETSPLIKDSLPTQGLSFALFVDKLYVCNWPIASQKASLLRHKTDGESLLPTGYVLNPVRKLYASLLEALCVGFEDGKWRDTIHCKYWPFLSLGPTGYDVKLNKGEFGPDAFSLRLRNPENSTFLSDLNYSKHLLERSGTILPMLLQPMKKLFHEKNYGSPYNLMVSHQQDMRPESTNINDDCVVNDTALSVVKTEVKEEDISTEDEVDLFNEIEESIAR